MGVCGKYNKKTWRVCRGVVCLALGNGVVGGEGWRVYFVLLLLVLCCLVLSCVVLCCLVLSCVVLCCLVLSCVVLCCLV
jgi:hypothetical protein